METEKKALPGVFELIKQSLALYKKNFKILVSISIVTVVLSILTQILFPWTNSNQTGLPEVSTGLMILFFIIIFIFAVLQTCSFIALVDSIKEIESGRAVSFTGAYKKSFGLFLSFLLVSLLTYFAILGSGILLIIPGIAVGGYIVFSLFTLIADGRKGLSSLSASYYYVKDNWFRVVLRLIAVVLISAVIYFIVGVVYYLISNIVGQGVDFKSLFSNNSGGVVYVLISNILYMCILLPICLIYGYLLFKEVKLTKPEPAPEVDFKKPRTWFKTFSWLGLLLPILIMIIVVAVSIFTGIKKTGSLQNQQSQQSLQSPFPAAATTLPINLGALEQKPYVNSDFGFSINLPKKWQTDASSEGVYIAPDIKKAGDADIIIEKKILPAEASDIPTEALMSNVAQSILSVASSSLANVSFQKYTISSTDAYLVTGTLTVGGQSINVNYYFIRDGLNVYTITAEAKTSVGASTSNTLLNSVNTFKIVK